MSMMTIMNIDIMLLLIMIMSSHCKTAIDLNDDSVDGDYDDHG